MANAYRLLVKIKNNRLWSAIVAVYPGVKSQSDAARFLNMSVQEIGKLLNMHVWPYSEARSRWFKVADRIAALLKETPEYLFDPKLYGRRPDVNEIAVEFGDEKWIEDHSRLLELPPSPEDDVIKHEMAEILGKMVNSLTPREQLVVNMRYGLHGYEESDLVEIGQALSVTKERVRQLEAKALRKMRHPNRDKRLREFMDV